MKAYPLALLLLGVLFWSACEESSTVGVDLIGEQNEPTTEIIPISEFSVVPFEDDTSGLTRLLAGTVEDPLLGTQAATSYLDLSGSFQAEDSTINRIELHLAPNYTYGDTTAQVALALVDILEEWDDADAPADTTLPTADTPVTEATFLPTDTLVRVPLPASWITEYSPLFLDGTFGAEHHGFALHAAAPESAAPGAIVGFDTENSFMWVITPTDTVEYGISQTLSSLRREGEPMLATDQALLQDGLGPTVRFDLDPSTLRDAALNGAVLRFHTDVETLQDAPPDFTRPVIERVQLFVIDVEEDTGEEIGLLVADGTVDEGGLLTFSSSSLRQVFQRTFFGEDLYEAFELRVAPAVNTINPLILYTPDAPERAPHVRFTLTPVE